MKEAYQKIEYTLLEDGTGYRVSKCYTKAMEISIPGTYNSLPVLEIGAMSFRGCVNLRSIKIPDGVTSIGYNAFCECRNLRYVSIPDSVTEIGFAAFERCECLESLSLPSGLTKIEMSTFSDCLKLSSIKIPEGVTIIENSAFDRCECLVNLCLPSKLTKIGNFTFSSCVKLSSISIPEGVTSIGDHAFYKCVSLSYINLPASLTEMGYGAFYGCERLSKISIEEGLKNIRYDTFSGCKNLNSIIIPESVRNIGRYAFENCISLKSIDIPSKVEWLGDGSFSGCRNLQNINISSGVSEIHGWVFRDCSQSLISIIVDPKNKRFSSEGNCLIDKKKHTLICGCKNSIIPNGVTTIGPEAFNNCSDLTNITIPESVTSIGEKAFYGCLNLTSIVIPNSVITIGEMAFSICSSLKTIVLPIYLSCINKRVFADCLSLENITIPDSVRDIHERAFSKCESLTDINLPYGVISIDRFAFSDCSSLQTIHIPNSIKMIGEKAFYSCMKLIILTNLSSKLDEWDSNWNCDRPVLWCGEKGNLCFTLLDDGCAYEVSRGTTVETDVTIPAYHNGLPVLKISNNGFVDLYNLKSITIEEGVAIIGVHAFSRCRNLQSVIIPPSLTTIENGAFTDCISLTNIDIPNSLTTIGENVFIGCRTLKNTLTDSKEPNVENPESQMACIKTKSIYDIICENINSAGRLPKGFTFPKTVIIPDGDNFVPGYRDFNGIYTTKISEPDKIAMQILDNLSLNQIDTVHIIIKKYGVFQIMPYLLSELKKGTNDLDLQTIMEHGRCLAFTSNDMELVKFGVFLLCLFDVENVQEIRSKLETLALYDEFTPFIVTKATEWKDGNNVVFWIAQKVDGWGKIQAVTVLEPRTAEIRDWLLRHGCSNTINDAYLGLLCAEKGDLIGKLRSGNIDGELFDGIVTILKAMLNEKISKGLSTYKYTKEALSLFFEIFMKFPTTDKLFNTSISLGAYVAANQDTLFKTENMNSLEANNHPLGPGTDTSKENNIPIEKDPPDNQLSYIDDNFDNEDREENFKSIYDIIRENVGSDGRLPKGFRLPDSIQTPDGENYVPGARDSLDIHPPAAIDFTDSIAYQIVNDIQSRNWESVYSVIKKYGAKRIQDRFEGAYGLIYSFPNLSPIYKIAYSLITTSDDIDLVKFGIALIGILEVEPSAKTLEVLETIALFEEFTYYVVTVAKCMAYSNNLIFKIAQKVDGWGKIEAVKKFIPYDIEKKDWILKQGCKNTISNNFLGGLCARRGDLISALKRENIDPDLYDGIATIINALLYEVNDKGTSKYSKANDALPLYLKHAQKHATTIKHFWLLKNLMTSIDVYKLTNKNKKDIVTQCSEICNSQNCRDLVLQTLSQPESPDFNNACDLAVALCLEISEPVKNNARQFPVKEIWTPPTFMPWTPTRKGKWTPPPERTKKVDITPKPSPKTKSIYDLICENLTPDDRLPSDFILPNANKNVLPGERVFARKYPNQITEPDKIAKQVLDFIILKQYGNILSIMNKYCITQFEEEFKSAFHQSSEEIDLQAVWRYGLSLTFKSDNIEVVRLGIVMIGLFNIHEMEGVINSLLDLAKYGEFTLDVIMIVNKWEDGNDYIFQIAQKTDGWAKLFTLFSLKPQTQQIKDWILSYGYENTISKFNLSLMCAENGDMINALRRGNLDTELYDGIATIINGLVVDESEKGLRGYPFAEESLSLYLKYAKSYAVTLQHYWYLVNIDRFMDRYDLKNKDNIRHQSREIYDTQACRDIVTEALAGNDDTDYNRAMDIAKDLGIAIKGIYKTDAKKIFFKTLHALNISNEKSIYEIISESVGLDGRLPDDFDLPNRKVDPNGIQFRPGDFDGSLYFFPQADDPKRVAMQLVDALQSKNEVEIVKLVSKYGVLQYWDYFMREYTRRANELDAKFIYDYATFLAFELADIELVKLGISLLCVFMLTDVHLERTQIETLALFDEFTFFVVENLEVWENGNDSIFKIAQKVDGWGKIRAVKSLKPETQEIRDWLLRDGCVNDVSHSKLALECATKGDLIGVLSSGRVDAELYDDIAFLIDALLGEHHNMGIRIYKFDDEEPEELPEELANLISDDDDHVFQRPKELGDYQHAEQAVTLYLQLAEKYAVTIKHLLYLLNMVRALEYTDIPSKDDLIQQCCKICDTPVNRDLILSSLADPENRDFFRAMQLAEGLDIDITDYLYIAVKKDPIKNSMYLSRLFHIPEYAQEFIALYESILPLQEMSIGMGDLLYAKTLRDEHQTLDILLGQLAEYPNLGTDLVKAAIYSPVTRDRNFACRVLKAWCKKLNKPLSDVSPVLYTALTDIVLREVNPKTKATMCKILGNDNPTD